MADGRIPRARVRKWKNVGEVLLLELLYALHLGQAPGGAQRLRLA